MPPSFYDLDRNDLLSWLKEQGEASYRAEQILHWQRSLTAPEEMTNLSKSLRLKLEKTFDFTLPEVLGILQSKEDETRKTLFRLHDGQILEAVLMAYRYGHSLCLSTQAGCRMGCDFCASAKAPFARNLSSGEIFTQVASIVAETGVELRRIVLMGIGEPLENLPAVEKFCRQVHDPASFNISYRRITISTCGLVPEIYALADLDLPITLSISLHSSIQEKRAELMPIAKRYKLPELLQAAHDYQAKTGRRVSFEYALFKDVNDREEDARTLAQLCRGQGFHVNLIPANHFPGSPYVPPSRDSVERFQEILRRAGVEVTVRRSLGRDIEAACGQLRLKYLAPELGEC